jgi:hypothetical protein
MTGIVVVIGAVIGAVIVGATGGGSGCPNGGVGVPSTCAVLDTVLGAVLSTVVGASVAVAVAPVSAEPHDVQNFWPD